MDEANEKLGEQLKVIAEPMRFKILQLLLDKHHCSRSLALTLGITESAVSQHMTALKKTGLVKGFRHGRHVHYVVDTQARVERGGLPCRQHVRVQARRWLERLPVLVDVRRALLMRGRLVFALVARHV